MSWQEPRIKQQLRADAIPRNVGSFGIKNGLK